MGQIAKIRGARAVGIARGHEKCRMLVDDLGFDAALDYRGDDLRGKLREHTPDYVDVFFDNVGGGILNEGLVRLARGTRVVICGAVSQYGQVGGFVGPSNYLARLISRASMTGFIAFDYADRYPEALTELSSWLAAGELRSVDDGRGWFRTSDLSRVKRRS